MISVSNVKRMIVALVVGIFCLTIACLAIWPLVLGADPGPFAQQLQNNASQISGILGIIMGHYFLPGLPPEEQVSRAKAAFSLGIVLFFLLISALLMVGPIWMGANLEDYSGLMKGAEACLAGGTGIVIAYYFRG